MSRSPDAGPPSRRGGRRRQPKGMVEVGYYRLRPPKPGVKLIEWPDRVHHFHREGFDLPAGAVLLAEGETFPNQAFSYGACRLRLQFHIELTTAMVGRWTGGSAERGPAAGRPGAAEHHFVGRALHDWKTAAFLERFLDMWLATGDRSLGSQ